MTLYIASGVRGGGCVGFPSRTLFLSGQRRGGGTCGKINNNRRFIAVGSEASNLSLFYQRPRVSRPQDRKNARHFIFICLKKNPFVLNIEFIDSRHLGL